LDAEAEKVNAQERAVVVLEDEWEGWNGIFFSIFPWT
jgi:hypothetical protein